MDDKEMGSGSSIKDKFLNKKHLDTNNTPEENVWANAEGDWGSKTAKKKSDDDDDDDDDDDYDDNNADDDDDDDGDDDSDGSGLV